MHLRPDPESRPHQPVPDLLAPDIRNQSASVLLPPAQAQQVLICGGGPVGKVDQTDATARSASST